MLLFRATLGVCGGSQARGWIRATTACLCHSHSNARSESCLRPTTAHGNAEYLTHWARPGIEPASSWILVEFITNEPQWELSIFISLKSWNSCCHGFPLRRNIFVCFFACLSFWELTERKVLYLHLIFSWIIGTEYLLCWINLSQGESLKLSVGLNHQL